jgi:hypothetical protein
MIKKLYIFIIIIYVISTLPAQNIHRVDSGQDSLDCKICHTCENPTVENPCLRNCPRFDKMSVHHSSDEGPEVIVMDVLSNIFVPVVFSHQLHAQMSDMSGGCKVCHHNNPPGTILKCGECHEISSQRADLSKPSLKGSYHRQCLGCHREWSHSTKCVVCHALRGKMTDEIVRSDRTDIVETTHPAIPEPDKLVYETNNEEGKLVSFYHNEHVQLFALKCVSCHNTESCDRCHDLTKPTLAEQIQPGKSIKISKSEDDHHKACFNCHSDEKCKFCHSDKEKNPFNHLTRTGWDLNPYHKSVVCSNCHLQEQKFSGLSKNCQTCHSYWSLDNFDHAVTGLILDENHRENVCEDCHLDKIYLATPNCEKCHAEEISYPSEKPGKVKN